MSFERLTDAGPKGGKAAFKESPSETMVKPQGGFLETPQPLGVAFVRSTNPKANCRLERTTYEMTALSASPFVRDILSYLFCIIFVNLTFPELTRSALPL